MSTRRPRRRFFLFGLPLFALFAVPVVALAAGFGHHGGWGHCDRGGELTAEQVKTKLARFTDHVLDEVDASDAQYDQVEGILDAAAPELVELKSRAHELRGEAVDALHAEDLDAAEVERVRGEAVQLFDAGTQEAVELFTDLRGVLTPEQRAELLELWERRHG